MRQQNAAQPVNLDAAAEGEALQQHIDPAALAEYLDNAEHADQRRQPSGSAISLSSAPRNRNTGWCARARASGTARPTDRRVDNPACSRVKRTIRSV